MLQARLKVPFQQLGGLRDDATFVTGPGFFNSTPTWLTYANYAASLAMVYHGYKRNEGGKHPVLWGLAWGLTGLIGVPFAYAQGFGKLAVKK